MAWLMTVSHASALAPTERRFRPIAATSHHHCTAVNASPTRFQSGPRHQRSTPIATKAGGRIAARSQDRRGIVTFTALRRWRGYGG